jgi:hypothetical protein
MPNLSQNVTQKNNGPKNPLTFAKKNEVFGVNSLQPHLLINPNLRQNVFRSMDLTKSRKSANQVPKPNWRLQSRNNSSKDPEINGDLTHLPRGVVRVREILKKQSTNKGRTLKTAKLAKILANIEAKYSNPEQMINNVESLPNSNVTEYERAQLLKNIQERYPETNYPPAPPVFDPRQATRNLTLELPSSGFDPRRGQRRLTDGPNPKVPWGARPPAPPYFNPNNVSRELAEKAEKEAARGGRKTRNNRRK